VPALGDREAHLRPTDKRVNDDDLDLLRSHVEPGEHVLAVSRMDERGRTDADLAPAEIHLDVGSAFDPIVVTDRRVLWAQSRMAQRTAWLAFDLVRSYTEVTKAHRYALILEHDPIERLQRVHAHRFLRWSWGEAEAVRTRTTTGFAFGRREAAAAVAIRSALESRRVPAHEPMRIPSLPRSEGTAYVGLTEAVSPERSDRGGNASGGS
jgi:hypothetical protein